MNRSVSLPVRLASLVSMGAVFTAVEPCGGPKKIVVRNVIENDGSVDASVASNTDVDVSSDCGCGCCDCGCGCDDGCDDSGTTATTDPVDTCECPEGYDPTPAGDACVRTDVFEATLSGKEYEVCPGDTGEPYGRYGAKFPGGLTVQDSFFGQDDGLSNGRLNEIGVWACDGATGAAGSEPRREWIGFSTCVDITEPGDYLIGIAADNRVRFTVDGVLTFERSSSSTANFNYWYVEPMSLTSGTHIIELLGYNDGSIAAFGAEIYGPFAPGSVSTDADMAAADLAGNIVWSTGDKLGQTFDLGESSGWQCPDGTAYDTCAAEPQCIELDEVPCEGDDGPGDDGPGDDGTGDDGTGDDPTTAVDTVDASPGR